MPRIFISYRRSDSITISGRIYDRLAAAFGDRSVFKDVDDIPLGADFRAVLDNEVATSDVQLVIIGSNWLNVTDERGQQRLQDPNDFVRIEVESGLKRGNNVLVIPVLVSGARMPTSDQLPPSLAELTYRNAAVVRDDPDFNRDMIKLIEQIKGHFGEDGGTKPTIPQRGAQRLRLPTRPRLDYPEIRWQISRRGTIGAGVILVLIAAFALLIAPFIASNSTPTATPTATSAATTPAPVSTAEATLQPTPLPVAAAPAFWLTYPVAENIFEITSPFDEERPSNAAFGANVLPLNEGLNIVARDAQGNPAMILAAQRGVVERVNTTATHPYGYFVTIRHAWYGEEWVTWYAHLGRVDVQVGQFVAAGTPIGVIGNTGNSSGNNLKFVVQHSGAGLANYVIEDVVNPEPLFMANPPAYDEAALVDDVSIPAGSRLESGAAFTKTWRVINTGTRSWDRSYRLRRVEGDALGMDDDEIPLLQTVVFLRPGDVTDISLELTAPGAAGMHRAQWQLVNGAGTLFVNVLSVEIEVVERIAQPTLSPTEDRGYDLLRFVADVTIPDRTVLSPRQEFTKTWRVRNGGTTTWSAGYELVFVDGDRMSGAVSIPLPEAVPGSTIEMSAALVAPNLPGEYRGYWQARNPAGDLFGAQLFVDIRIE